MHMLWQMHSWMCKVHERRTIKCDARFYTGRQGQLPCKETASICCKLAHQHPHPRLFPSIQTQFTQIAQTSIQAYIRKRLDVMLIRKDNIKSDYAARGPSLTGLTIILKSNVLLFSTSTLGQLGTFQNNLLIGQMIHVLQIIWQIRSWPDWARARREKEIELELNSFLFAGKIFKPETFV